MNGLIVLGTTVIGAGLGFGAGMVGAMLWADMDLGSLDAVGYLMVGTLGGAAAGAYIGGQIVG